MFAAVKSGDANKVSELIRQDPGFDVNMEVDELGFDVNMERLHSTVLLAMATLTSSSGGLCLGGRWISGNQGMSTRRMPLARQGREAGQKW